MTSGLTAASTEEGVHRHGCNSLGTGMRKRGAGEVLLTSMDGDGTKDGYDIELNKAINDAVDIPVIASGGVGNPQHIVDVFKRLMSARLLQQAFSTSTSIRFLL